jgi:hypothetical protein
VAIGTSLGGFFTYFALFGRLGKRRFNIRKLRRIGFTFSGTGLGLMIWFSVVIPLALDSNIPAEIVILLLLVLMVVCAFIVDTIMKRKDYRPFMG